MDEYKKLLIELIEKSKDFKAISFLYEIAKKILDQGNPSPFLFGFFRQYWPAIPIHPLTGYSKQKPTFF